MGMGHWHPRVQPCFYGCPVLGQNSKCLFFALKTLSDLGLACTKSPKSIFLGTFSQCQDRMSYVQRRKATPELWEFIPTDTCQRAGKYPKLILVFFCCSLMMEGVLVGIGV